MMILTIPLLSHRDNNRILIYKTMTKMIITEMWYQRDKRDRPHWWSSSGGVAARRLWVEVALVAMRFSFVKTF